MVCPVIAAPTFEPYALPLQEELAESQDGSLGPDWSTQHMPSDDMWDLYHFSTTSSANEFSTSPVEVWPSDAPELVDVSVSTYLPLETDTSEVFVSSTTAEQIVPVLKTTSIP